MKNTTKISLLILSLLILLNYSALAQNIEGDLKIAINQKDHKPGLAFPWSMIPDFANVENPKFRSITHTITDSTLLFRFSGIDFLVKFNTEKFVNPTIIASRGDRILLTKEFGTGYFDPEECRIRCSDVDSNGFDDIFMSFQFGAINGNSSIIGIESFFFLSDTTFKYIELSSYEAFYNPFALFGDYNHDGRFEFVCFSYTNSDFGFLDYINLFSIKNGSFKNISYDTPRFPVRFIMDSVGDTKVLSAIPDEYEKILHLKQPQAWEY